MSYSMKSTVSSAYVTVARVSQVQWGRYAETYDMLLQYSKPYQEILKYFETCIASESTCKKILDIGAGTGNFSVVAAKQRQVESVVAIEPDAGMVERLKIKVADGKLPIQILNQSYPNGTQDDQYDLIICVHAMFTMKDPMKAMRTAFSQLRQGGVFFICDFGRVMDVSDWKRYFFKSLVSQVGIVGALKILWKGREIAIQNENIRRLQEQGAYWQHSMEELKEAIVECGFNIIRSEVVYRGYSDLVICTK